jgi:hypothetical protein
LQIDFKHDFWFKYENSHRSVYKRTPDMKTAIALIFCIIFSFSCSKTVTELPPATQVGANIFGASVDGKLWVPAGFGIVPTAPTLEARFMPDSDFIINARNFSSSPTETEFEIFIRHMSATGTYSLNTVTGKYPLLGANYAYYVKRKFTPLNEWMTTDQYTGTVTITKNDNHIVSGTFQFNAINLYNNPQPLTVTEGRFDVTTQ